MQNNEPVDSSRRRKWVGIVVKLNNVKLMFLLSLDPGGRGVRFLLILPIWHLRDPPIFAAP